MKHTNHHSTQQSISVTKTILFFALSAFTFLVACKKEVADIATTNKSATASSKRTIVSESLLLRSVQHQVGNESYNTIEVLYDSGRHVGGANFLFGDGSVRSMPTTMFAADWINIVYKYDKSSTKLAVACAGGSHFMRYKYDMAGNPTRSDYDDINDASNNYYILYSSEAGNNIHDKYTPAGNFVERTVYCHNPDGSFRAIEKFDPEAGMKLKGRILFHNSYTAEQLAKWKETVAVFPEPVLPFYMMMLLSLKVEMQLEPGYCCDDLIVDGQIITVISRTLWGSGKKVSIDFCKTDKGNDDVSLARAETLSLNYTKVEND